MDGNRDKTLILMHVGHVVNMDTIQMNAIVGKMIGIQVETSKGIMHQPPTEIMMSAYLLCNI